MGVVFNPFTGNFDFVSEAFRTIVPTAGANVVADAQKDTLTLTSSDSSLVITGTAATDTLNFTGGSGAFSFKTIVGNDGDNVVADQMADTLTLTSSIGDLEISGNATTDTFDITVQCTLDRILSNGNTTEQLIEFTDEGSGIAFFTGTGLKYDGGELFIDDINSNTTFSIYAQETNIWEVLKIQQNGSFEIEIGASDARFIRDSATSFQLTKTAVGAITFNVGIPMLSQTTNQHYFRDTALGFNSSVDGQLDGFADVKFLVTTPIFQTSANLTVGSTLTINGITYTFPASQGASQFLQTNGSGTLSWATVSTATETLAQTLAAGNTSSGNNIVMSTADEIRLRDTTTRLYSNASNEVTLEATTKTTIGVAGDIELGDGTLRVMRPNTDLKIDLGTGAFRFNEAYISKVIATTAGMRTQLSTANVSNPPTDAELDSAFGTPGTVGSGFIAYVDDNNADTNFWLVGSNGTSWWYTAMTKAV